MIVKRNFDVRKVFWNIRYEVFSSLFVSVVIYTLHIFQVLEASLPFSIVSILGSALAIFIAFRNQIICIFCQAKKYTKPCRLEY